MPNSKENQACWTCAHFQLYDASSTPTDTWGDCRKDPPPAFLWNSDYFDQYVPFIAAGDSFWCSSYKVTPLVTPPNPGSGASPTWPDVWWNWSAWNAKGAINQSCWNCNHFQKDDPEDPQNLLGECRKLPPEPVTYSVIDGSGDIIPGRKYVFTGEDNWCGCWEEEGGK